MQTIIVSICKDKIGNVSAAGNYRLVSLLTASSPSCLNTRLAFRPASHHFLPQETTSLISSHNMAWTCLFLLHRLFRYSYYISKDIHVLSSSRMHLNQEWPTSQRQGRI